MDWVLGGLQFFASVVILVAILQIVYLIGGWVKRRWL